MIEHMKEHWTLYNLSFLRHYNCVPYAIGDKTTYLSRVNIRQEFLEIKYLKILPDRHWAIIIACLEWTEDVKSSDIKYILYYHPA